MKSDIREAAARAAHRFGLETCAGNRTADGAAEIGFEAGYLAGYEAAKAEYREKSPCGTAYVTEKVQR